MAFKTKLEIYKLILESEKGNPSFLKRFTSRVDQTDSAAFMDIVQKFFNIIDLNDFHTSTKKQKALTAYDTQKTDSTDPSIIPIPNDQILCGYIEGGKFGKKRVKSAIGEKQTKELLGTKTLILDRYYFLLYLPLDSKIGISIIQSYTSESISDIFLDLLKDFLTDTTRGYKCKSERFFPKSIADEFNNESTIKKFSFSTRMLVGVLEDSSIKEKKKEFKIKVEAVASENIKKTDYKKWLKKITQSIININNTPVELSTFESGRVHVENERTGKPATFEIERDFEIKPVIYLDDDKVQFDEEGVPTTESLKKYCIKLLEEIKKEIYQSANWIN